MQKIKKLIKFFTRIIKSKRFEYFLLFLILIGGFGVRLYKINNPVADWHAWRQVDTISVSRIYLDNGINLLKPQYYDVSPIQTGYTNPEGLRFVEFPIFNLINVILYKVVPNISLEVWARIISILCAVGSSYFLYLIGKRLLGKFGGLTAAFFYAFIPFNIYFTRVILPEPMAVFFVTSSMWFFLVFVKSRKSKYLYLSTLLIGLGMLLKPYVLFYAPFYLYLYIKQFGWKAFTKYVNIYISLLLIFIPFLLWRIWMNQEWNYRGVPLFDWLYKWNGIRFRPAFWRWMFGERLGYLILGIWGLPLFVFGLLKKNLPILMTLLGMFIYISFLADGNVRHDYYQVIAVPAVCLALASGVQYLLTQTEFNKWLTRGFLGFSIVMMLGMGWYNIKGNYQVNHYEVIEAGKRVDELVPKDAIVIAPFNADTTFLYQTHRFGWPIVDRSFDELIKLGADYFVSVNFDNDTNFLMKNYKIIEQNPRFVIIDLHQKITTSSSVLN